MWQVYAIFISCGCEHCYIHTPRINLVCMLASFGGPKRRRRTLTSVCFSIHNLLLQTFNESRRRIWADSFHLIDEPFEHILINSSRKLLAIQIEIIIHHDSSEYGGCIYSKFKRGSGEVIQGFPILHYRLCFLQCDWWREISLDQKVININEAQGITWMSPNPLSQVGSGHKNTPTTDHGNAQSTKINCNSV